MRARSPNGARFHANWADIAALCFDDRFRRLWDYYLCYCEAGFAEGTIDVSHYVRCRGGISVGRTRR